MCGRYVIQWLPDEISERFQLRRIPLSLFESFNAAPTQELPIVRESDEGERELVMLRWGLIPRWSKPGETKAPAPFNARGESVLEKPMFRSLVKRKRCLVPATGYYEWKQIGGRKQPFLFEPTDQEIFAFAGLYDEVEQDGEPVGSYTVITTEANALAAGYHHRMPVILQPEDEDLWVSHEVDDGNAVAHLLAPYPAERMAVRPVSPAVNNVRNNNPSLIEPLDEDEIEALTDGERAQKPLI